MRRIETVAFRARWLATVVALAALAVIYPYAFQAPPPTTGVFVSAPAVGSTCTQTISSTSTNLATTVSAAAAGSVICLNAGTYATGTTYSGITKSSRVTIRATTGQTVITSVRLQSGTNGLTFDHLTLTNVFVTDNGTCAATGSGCTFSNITFGTANSNGQFQVDCGNCTNSTFDPVNMNLLLDTFTSAGKTVPNARIHVSFSQTSPIGFTVRNGTMIGGCADGVNTGSNGVTVEDSYFQDIDPGQPGCTGSEHSDAIQWVGTTGSGQNVIRDNYVFRTEQQVGSYDESKGGLIENNIFDAGAGGRPWQIELYSDDGTVVRHNTILERSGCAFSSSCGVISIDRKLANDVGINTQVYDNIARSVDTGNGSTVSVNHHNVLTVGCCTGTGGSNIQGPPTYTAGSLPSTVAGFALTSGSVGHNAASDGTDVGANVANVLALFLTPDAMRASLAWLMPEPPAPRVPVSFALWKARQATKRGDVQDAAWWLSLGRRAARQGRTL